ncbi:MAG: hypothetical protein E7Z93_07145 [Cyanobacteria bacterium SIG32]|nr:hypothetical protein [Cyanobacteria bacterium SIG32]
MKTKLFLTALIVAVIALPSSASKTLTPEHSTSEEYLKNYGHSDAMIEMIHKTKAKANGEVYVSKQDQSLDDDFCLVRWIKKALMYIDPAVDDNKFMNHDIKINPGAHDL